MSLRDRVSDRERLYILMLYDRQVTGNLQKELQTLESWAQTYPRDCVCPGRYRRVGSHAAPANMKGEFKPSEEAIRLDPDIPFPYGGVAVHNLFLDRFAAGRGGVAGGPRSANWKSRNFWSSVTISRF